MLRRWRSLAGLSMVAGTLFVVSVVGTIPVAAAQGDMWVQPAGTPEETAGHSQEVHLACGAVDLWGDGLDNTSGPWVLYQIPPPNSAVGTVASGTYAYSGSGSEVIATIPKAAFDGAAGDHFKVVIDNDNSKSKTFWVDCKPSAPVLTTIANPTSGPIGTLLNDSATLESGDGEGGTVTFHLYNPNGVIVDTETTSIVEDGTSYTANGYNADMVGTWHWSATFSGDDAEDTAQSADEPVVITQAEPAISTTPNPTSGLVGVTLNDTATLSGGYNPGGQITFTLYDPADTPVHTESVTVSGNAQYSTSQGHVAGAPGTWHWSAAYSGDTNNKAVQSLMASEPVVITSEQQPAQPDISTTVEKTPVAVGTTLKDTATLTNGNSPTGHITFTLYDPNDQVAYTEDVAVDGNGQYTTATGHVADSVGTWHWAAAYSGDGSNFTASSNKADEPVVVTKADPAISTTPNPTSVAGSGTLQDTASLTGGFNPGGQITFTLYDPSNTAVHTETVNVSGNGTYSTSVGHLVNTPGTWHWGAAYSGDANNSSVQSALADEPVTVTGTGDVLADTGLNPPAMIPALILMVLGFLGILAGAVAWRRRAA